MTAPPRPMASTTAQMLSEIGTGTAAELLMGVRYNTCPPGPTFIPELDTHLLEARPHGGGSSLRRGDLVELVGPSGSGKTTLCVFFLLTTLLPPTLAIPLDYPFHRTPTLSVPLGGRGMTAAFLAPRTHRSVIQLLSRGMAAHIDTCMASAIAEHDIKHYDTRAPAVQAAVDAAIVDAFARLYILRPPATAMGWTESLRKVGTLPGIAVVVVDGFSDGFWPERWADEERSSAEKERRRAPGVFRGGQDASIRDAWEALTALRRDMGAVVVITVQGLRANPNTPFYKPHLPAPYPSPFVQRYDVPESLAPWPLNVQLTLLGRARGLQLPAETMLADALRDRAPIPDVQVFDAVVRVPGGRGAVGTTAGARWTFGVARHGLVPFTQ